MRFTARDILGTSVILIIGLCALGAWRAFFMVMVTPGVSDIWRPTAWFSLLAIFFFLGTAAWTKRLERVAAATVVFLPGIFFLRSWEYAAAGALSAVFVFWSSTDIAREFLERVRFHFFKSVRTGQFYFIAGLALSLASGYYVFLKDASWEELVPRFRIGEEMTNAIFKVAGVVHPSFAALADEDITVDAFLLELERNKKGAEQEAKEEALGDASGGEIFGGLNTGGRADVLPEIIRYLQEGGALSVSDANREEIAQELFLRSGREQIAALAGYPVEGDEKISDILSIALQHKLVAFLNGVRTTDHIPSQAIPFFLSLLLFFTLLPFMTFFAVLCALGAQLLFIGSLRLGWLKLVTVAVEQQRLAE